MLVIIFAHFYRSLLIESQKVGNQVKCQPLYGVEKDRLTLIEAKNKVCYLFLTHTCQLKTRFMRELDILVISVLYHTFV